MNKSMIFAMTMGAIWLSSCSSMHDGMSWEHTGDKTTHQTDDSRSVFEHKH